MDRIQNNPIGALKMVSELMPTREQAQPDWALLATALVAATGYE
jgi:hypothetical protein